MAEKLKRRENFEVVRNAESILGITGNEFPKGKKKSDGQEAEFFDKIGNRAHIRMAGDILLNKRATKDD